MIRAENGDNKTLDADSNTFKSRQQFETEVPVQLSEDVEQRARAAAEMAMKVTFYYTGWKKDGWNCNPDCVKWFQSPMNE